MIAPTTSHRAIIYALILESIMAKAARVLQSISTPATSADRAVREQPAADSLVMVLIFSLTGLLVSLVALIMGLPLVWN
jgi:hypothetical protein